MAADLATQLEAWRHGDRGALDAAISGLYPALRDIALGRLARESGMKTFDPTDLVNEAMLRMLRADKPYANRLHFLATAALYMRSILTDRARDIQAGRRPRDNMTVTLGAIGADEPTGPVDLLALDQALSALEKIDEHAARALELSAFSGMTREEIAEVTARSRATIGRDLRFARAYVNRALA